MIFKQAVLFTEARTDILLMPILKSSVWFTKPFSCTSSHIILKEPHEVGIIHITYGVFFFFVFYIKAL